MLGNHPQARLLLIYIVNQTLHWLIIGTLVPVFTLMQLSKGLDLFQVGVAAAIMSGTVIALELPTGGLADAIGRKRLYLISMTTSMLAYTVVAFAWDFGTVAVGFALMGVARALSSGSMDAWFVDELFALDAAADLQPALAKVGVFVTVGLGVGSLLGGVLPMALGPITAAWLPVFDVYSANLIVAVGLAGIQLALTTILVREHRPPTSDSLWEGVTKVPEILSSALQYGVRHRTVATLLVGVIALGFGLMAIEQYWQPQLKGILGSDEQTWLFGLLSAGYFFAGALGSGASSLVVKAFRRNYPLVLFATKLLMGILLLALAWQQGFYGFATFYLTLLVFVGAANPPEGAVFNHHIPAEKRSTLLSLQSLCVQLGGLVGSVAIAYVAKTFSISLGWTIAAVILMASAFLYLTIPNLPDAANQSDGAPTE